MPGLHAVLDKRRSGDEAPRFPTLLQRSPHARRAGRTPARPERRARPCTRDSHVVSLAGALSRAVSNTDSRMTCGAVDGKDFRLSRCVERPLALVGAVLSKPVWRR